MKKIYVISCGLGLMLMVGCAPTVQGVAQFGIHIQEKPYRVRQKCERVLVGYDYDVYYYRGKWRERKRPIYHRFCRPVKEYYEPGRNYRWPPPR